MPFQTPHTAKKVPSLPELSLSSFSSLSLLLAFWPKRLQSQEHGPTSHLLPPVCAPQRGCARARVRLPRRTRRLIPTPGGGPTPTFLPPLLGTTPPPRVSWPAQEQDAPTLPLPFPFPTHNRTRRAARGWCRAALFFKRPAHPLTTQHKTILPTYPPITYQAAMNVTAPKLIPSPRGKAKQQNPFLLAFAFAAPDSMRRRPYQPYHTHSHNCKEVSGRRRRLRAPRC